MSVNVKDKTRRIKLGLWAKLLLTTLLASLIPIFLLGYNALKSSEVALDQATSAATDALDDKALEALQVQASQTAQAITKLLENSVQDVLGATLVPRAPEAYRAFSEMHNGELRYPAGSKANPQEVRQTVPLYREITFIDETGQEKVRIEDNKIIPPAALRNISDPANTSYKTEDYFAQTRTLARGQVYISHFTAWHTSIKLQPALITSVADNPQSVLGAEYGKFLGVIRFATPVFNEQNQFDGMLMLSLDVRHLMEYIIHIQPVSEKKWTIWPDYVSGNYAYIWDDEGYLIAHPLLYRLRGFDENGKLLPSFNRNMTDEEKARNSFRMQEGNPAAQEMYNATRRGEEGLAFNNNQAGTRNANVYAPIKFSQGDFAKTGIFGGIVIGANTKEFHKAADTIRGDLLKDRATLQDRTLWIMGLALVLLLGTVSFVSLSITRPIHRLTTATRLMERGEMHDGILNKVLNRRIFDEVTRLALVFRQMVNTVQQRERELKDSHEQLAEYSATLEHKVEQRTVQLAQANQEITGLNDRLKAENLRMSNELEVTRKLQQMMLPKEHELERISGLEVVGYMSPADEVGGDYYDVLHTENGLGIKIGIGDVTGHGLESGVLMIMVQTAVRTLLANNETDPVRFFAALNRTIYENVQRMNSDKNLTLSLIDYEGGKLRLSGQHEEMIIVRANGEIERKDTMNLGFPIGLEEDIAQFVGETLVQLEAGDVVILYTDGIPEAENMDKQQYGLPRLVEVAQCNRHLTALAIKQAIIDDLMQHIGSQKVFDDITLVVLKQKQEVHYG